MTPGDLNTYCRQQYNATSDNFFSDTELYLYMYDAAIQLAREAKVIRNVYTAPTVIDQQEYDRPSRSIAIKRITYEGQKLIKIVDKEDDLLTSFNQATTQTGAPRYYWEWSTTLILRPVPDAVGTLRIYSFDQPDTVSATSTFDVPSRYHPDMGNFVLWKMALKDKNFQVARIYQDLWLKNLADAKRDEAKLVRGDSNASVFAEVDSPIWAVGAL